jgi:hypothetical protein
VRATLVQRSDIERRAVARRVLAREEPLLGGVHEDDERAGLGEIGREPIRDRQGRVGRLDLLERPDRQLAAEAAREIWPQEPDRPCTDLQEPERHTSAQGTTDQLSSGKALDLLVAQGLERLGCQGGGLVDGFDVVVAHAGSADLGHREKYMPGAVTYGMMKV